MMEEKQCSKCKELKAVNEFSAHKATKDGLNSVCKPCKRKVTTLYRDNNREKVREQWNKHYTLTKKKPKPLTPPPSNTPITRRIGVILCSKSKQDYTCSVREMYDCSISFKARRIFMDLAYDEWYVNTTSKGFMEPSMVIEPYDSWYIQEARMMKGNIVTNEMIDEWLEKLKQQFPNRDEIQLDCHLSFPYYKKLKTIFPNIRYIKPQQNFTVTAWRYHDATKMFLEGKSLEECILKIEEPWVKPRPAETEKWFYHVSGDKFYGKAWGLASKYSIDNGSCYGLSMGTNDITYGWVIDESLVKHIYTTKGGQYRLPKYLKKAPTYFKRAGLREALNNLNVTP